MGRPVCSFDPDGLIFAAGVESRVVKLYDLRAFDKVQFGVGRMCFVGLNLQKQLMKGQFRCFEVEICGNVRKHVHLQGSA